MNKAYKSVWNESLEAWVAVSELTTARKKSKSQKIISSSIAAILLTMSAGAYANYTAGGGTSTGYAGTAISPTECRSYANNQYSIAMGCEAEVKPLLSG